MSQIVLELKGISKTFPGVKALNEMQLQVYAGEVHALMGENGAGKSTLMNIINGSYQKDSGEIYMDGRLVEIRSINDAAALGISMIHQELNYVPALTVADNIFLGRELVSGKWLQKQKMLEQAQKLLDEMEIHLDPASKMCDLSVSQQQMVEIIRAVSNNARVLIMDEPTSAITSEEVEVLFRIIDKLKKKDVAIIYITHKMDEVFRIADRVTVMRDGCYISSFPREQLEETSLISMMVGREIKNMFPKSNTPTTEEFFRVEHLTGGRFTDISFSLNRGEILGVAGLMGAGRTEIMRALFGVDSCKCGEIYLHGKKVCIKKPEDAIKAGIGFITENRKSEGLILDFSISRNIALPSVDTFAKRSVINVKNETAFSAALSQKLGVRAASIDLEAGALSGGNQQKVVIAKWIGMNPSIIIMDEPTRGIDVGAKRDIYDLMNELTSQGVAIIMVSSELPEVIGMSDRILVIHEGKIAGELNHDEATQEKIITLATGGQ